MCQVIANKMYEYEQQNDNVTCFMIVQDERMTYPIKPEGICDAWTDDSNTFMIRYNLQFEKIGNTTVRRVTQRAHDIDNINASRNFVYNKIHCLPKQFQSENVYVSGLWWLDGFNFAKYHSKCDGSLDVLRWTILNWGSAFFANAEEHQFLAAYLPSKTDPDSVIELIAYVLCVYNSQLVTEL